MAKFKVGDKVRAAREYDGKTPPGIGEVVYVFESGVLLVRFPGWDQGSLGLWEYGREHWFYPYDTAALELVTDNKRDESLYGELARLASHYGVDITVTRNVETIYVKPNSKHVDD